MISSGISKSRIYKLPNLSKKRKKTRNLKDKILGAENFTYGELIASQTATRLNIDNSPTEDQWESLELLAVRVLMPIRKKFGPIRISSGFRSVKLNDAVGGAQTSYHSRGMAVDLEPVNSQISLLEIIKFIHEELDYTELICEYFPDGWVHVAYNPSELSKEIKLKDSQHNYQKVDYKYLERLYR